MEISGSNLDIVQDAKLNTLENFAKTNELFENQIEILKLFEKYLKEIFGLKTTISAIPITNNKVQIPEGTIFHRTGLLQEKNLESYAKYGILASEFFGSWESQGEGRFCAFLNKVRYDYSEARPAMKKNYENINRQNRTPTINNIVFYLDTNNEIMQELIKNEYFEFIKNLENNQNPEYYNQTIFSLLNEVIYPLSPAGKKMHTGIQSNFHDWIAVPGGIPASLINGIAINSENLSNFNLEYLQSLFPKAIIFDENNNVLLKSKDFVIKQKDLER